MNIVAINGSHRAGKNTAALLNVVLDEAAALGASTELIELANLNIGLCTACSSCLRKPRCSVQDDMQPLAEKLLAADGIVLGSPVYFVNVTTLMKNFMDRTRWMHMTGNMLEGRIGAAVTTAGLEHGGQEATMTVLERWIISNSMHLVDSRDAQGEVLSWGAMGSLLAGYEDGKPVWRRSVMEDGIAVESCKQVARNVVALIGKMRTGTADVR